MCYGVTDRNKVSVVKFVSVTETKCEITSSVGVCILSEGDVLNGRFFLIFFFRMLRVTVPQECQQKTYY